MSNKLTHQDFIKRFGTGNRIDLNRTLVQDEKFKLFDIFGTNFIASAYDGFKYNLENLTGQTLSGWNYEDPYWVFTGESPSVVEEDTITSEDVITEEIEPVIVNEIKVIDTETSVIEEVLVDWDWINSLENKKYHKEELDKYAEEKFKIKLNKRNTLENMIADFKSQLKG